MKLIWFGIILEFVIIPVLSEIHFRFNNSYALRWSSHVIINAQSVMPTQYRRQLEGSCREKILASWIKIYTLVKRYAGRLSKKKTFVTSISFPFQGRHVTHFYTFYILLHICSLSRKKSQNLLPREFLIFG